MTSPPRRRPASPTATAPSSSHDILRNIFHCLPSDPSALTIVSSTYNACRHVVFDQENFICYFQTADHRTPPLIGFYSDPFYGVLQFTPTTPPTPPLPPAPHGLQLPSLRLHAWSSAPRRQRRRPRPPTCPRSSHRGGALHPAGAWPSPRAELRRGADLRRQPC